MKILKAIFDTVIGLIITFLFIYYIFISEAEQITNIQNQRIEDYQNEYIDSLSAEEKDSIEKTFNAKIGQHFIIEQLDIGVDSIEEYALSEFEWYNIPENYIIYKCYISVKNISDSDASIYSFEYYADDLKCESVYVFQSDKLDSYFTLAPDKINNGYIYFAIPNDTAVLEIMYQYNIWSDKKITWRHYF